MLTAIKPQLNLCIEYLFMTFVYSIDYLTDISKVHINIHLFVLWNSNCGVTVDINLIVTIRCSNQQFSFDCSRMIQ